MSFGQLIVRGEKGEAAGLDTQDIFDRLGRSDSHE